jgi:Tfp pilus assembly protein PilO
VLTAKVSEVSTGFEKQIAELKQQKDEQEALQADLQDRMNQSLQNIRDTLHQKEESTQNLEKYR